MQEQRGNTEGPHGAESYGIRILDLVPGNISAAQKSQMIVLLSQLRRECPDSGWLDEDGHDWSRETPRLQLAWLMGQKPCLTEEHRRLLEVILGEDTPAPAEKKPHLPSDCFAPSGSACEYTPSRRWFLARCAGYLGAAGIATYLGKKNRLNEWKAWVQREVDRGLVILEDARVPQSVKVCEVADILTRLYRMALQEEGERWEFLKKCLSDLSQKLLWDVLRTTTFNFGMFQPQPAVAALALGRMDASRMLVHHAKYTSNFPKNVQEKIRAENASRALALRLRGGVVVAPAVVFRTLVENWNRLMGEGPEGRRGDTSAFSSSIDAFLQNMWTLLGFLPSEQGDGRLMALFGEAYTKGHLASYQLARDLTRRPWGDYCIPKSSVEACLL